MARETRWSHLIPGLLTLGATAAAVIGVFAFARPGTLRGDTVRLYAPTSQARNVIEGTEVWLAGQKIGLVDRIDFRSAGSDTSARLLLALDVLTEAAEQIRRNSFAQIRAGGSFFGSPVVFISPGSADAPPLRDGDTLITRPQGDVEGITSQIAYAARDFRPLLENFQLIVAQLDSARGAAGAVFGPADGTARPGELASLQRRTAGLTRKLANERGTLALALNDTTLRARTSHALAQVDSVRALLASGQTSVGRFRRDSTLARTLTAVRNDVSITRALLAQPNGAAGRTTADSAIVRQITQIEAELSAIIRDIQRRPLRYIAF